MPTLFLIDGSSQMYRAYHALSGLTSPDGRATNAVFGFVAMLRKLLADHRPTHIVCAFDLAGPTFRSDLADTYKANRPPMPQDLVDQVPWVHQACEALGVKVLTSEGFEADDVIGTLAERGAAAGFDVAIVTGDKDFFQLVGGPVRVFNPRDNGTWYDEPGVVGKFGVPPSKVVDVLSLMGDAVDNVKGVPGIGEKGARDLILQFGSLDALLEGAERVTQKRYREALVAHQDEARQSRDLVTIRVDVPIDLGLESFRYEGANRDRCFALFSRLGFRTLTHHYAPAATPAPDQSPSAAGGTVTDALLDAASNEDGEVTAPESTPDAVPAAVTGPRDYAIVESLEALAAVVMNMRASGRFGIHVLGDASAPMRARIVGLAVALPDSRVRYVPIGHRALVEVSNLSERRVLETLRPVLEDPGIEKIGHDVKFAAIVLARHGVAIGQPGLDTMLASYLLDSTRAPHALEDISLVYLGHAAARDEETYGRGAKATAPADLPASATLTFACERADLPLRLAEPLRAKLAEGGLDELYRTMELPLLPVLADIEQAGVRIDVHALAELSQTIERDVQERSAKAYELAGGQFNINSPKQLSEVLFDKLQLPASRKTGKTKVASTSVDVLEELAQIHELPRLVLEWRTLQKLKGTYIDALPLLVHPDTGRVHTSFNQAVAATGRLSSSDPNLQNIPIRTELGREIRKAFVADPGCVLISADYSQIELRVLAHLSGDAALIEAFQRGEDIHDRTALGIFGANSGLDRKEMRSRAKMVNYALLYGKTAFTLARDIGVSQQAAQAFIDAYFAGFPGVRVFIDRTLQEARVSGVVKTIFGRRRPVPELNSSNGQVRAATERVAVNMPIQGTAADIMKRAMIDVHQALMARPAGPAGRRARMILTVHDELLFEVPREEASEVAALVKTLMEGAVPLAVPLTVDVGTGENWNDAKN